MKRSLLTCLALIFAGLGLSALAWGMPLPGTPVTLVQPDGRSFVALPGGDEWFNWTSIDGTLIVRDAAGWWCYAEVRGAALAAGPVRVGQGKPPASAATLSDLPPVVTARGRPAVNSGASPTGASAAPPADVATRADRPVLVVLVGFQDQALTTTDAYWNNLFFGTTGKTVRTYVEEVSEARGGGPLHLVPAAETSGTADDGIVRVQFAGQYHPNPYGAIDNRNRWLTYNALTAADPFVNFAAFETDSSWGLSSRELHIVIVVAGYEHGYDGDATPTPAVHAHRWGLGFVYQGEAVPVFCADSTCMCQPNPGTIYDGGYVQMGELHTDHAATIGVICHELGHEMGLPDLYDPTGASAGIGGFDLMSYGGWGRAAGDSWLGETPVQMSAWSKRRLLWAMGTFMPGGWGSYTLWAHGSGHSPDPMLLTTIDPNQYFLIENRQLQGFDAGLYRFFSINGNDASAGGLAVWHIDDSVADNSNWAHKRVDLEEANAGLLGYSQLDYNMNQGVRAQLFYVGHVGSFGDATTPGTRLYNGRVTDIEVSSITAAAERMKLYVAWGQRPVVAWCTYLGTADDDTLAGFALDPNENVYVGYPRMAQFKTSLFKLDSSGGLVWSTTFDYGLIQALAVSAAGQLYATGRCSTSLAPCPSPSCGIGPPYVYDYTFGPMQDAFVARFDTAGSSQPPGGFRTYLGGSESVGPPYYSGWDAGWAIAVDASGQALVAGETTSANFPDTEGSNHGGNTQADGFVTKFNAAATAVLHSRYLSEGTPIFGTATLDKAYGVACDTAGNSWVVGTTQSSDFEPIACPNGFNDTMYGVGDGFVVKANPDGTLLSASFLGGQDSISDVCQAIALDSSGCPYITGMTYAGNFPLVNPLYSFSNYPYGQAFVTKLNAAGTAIAYSTLYGGTDNDYGCAIDLDSQNQMYVAGWTDSYDLWQSAGTLTIGKVGGRDAFIVMLAADGQELKLGTYFGGTSDDEARGLAVGPSGAVYVAGYTKSTDFPVTPGAYDTTFNGGTGDIFVAKILRLRLDKSLIVVTPYEYHTWCIGREVTLEWASTGAGSVVDIELTRNGTDWSSLFAGTPNDGSEPWTVTGPTGTNCMIRISDPNDPLLTETSGCFQIAATGDFDGSGQVSADDLEVFADCLAGEGVPVVPGAGDCGNADLENDGDVDLADFAVFQMLFGGSP